ncbi:MAG TPA: RNA polymerase sigma factor, partial [Polyangiales bacterium]|nr:RNA polymerase sigma factor [Polyangiales bacterium]
GALSGGVRRGEWPAVLGVEARPVAPAREVAAEPGAPVSTATVQEITRLFELHADFVQRSLSRFGVPDADVEDALQEVFVVVANRLESYVERGAMRAWLFVIARQVALHALRANKRRARQTLELSVVPEPEDPHASFERRQAIALVDVFLAQLDERIAQVFFLAEIEQLSVPEIAAALGVKLNTVYSRLRLSRAHFEKWLARLEEDEP